MLAGILRTACSHLFTEIHGNMETILISIISALLLCILPTVYSHLFTEIHGNMETQF